MATGGGLSHHPPFFLGAFGKDALAHSNVGSLGNRRPVSLQHLEAHPRQVIVDERDAFITWLRSEFAAANAIIDAMCHHLRAISEPSDYDFVLSCIQQRRHNWAVILHMQHFYPVAEVVHALEQVASRRQQDRNLVVSHVHQASQTSQRGSVGIGESRTEILPAYPVSSSPVAQLQTSTIMGVGAHESASGGGCQSSSLKTNVQLHEELSGFESNKITTDPISNGPLLPSQISKQKTQSDAQVDTKKEGPSVTSKSSGSILGRISNIDMNAFSKEDEETRLSLVKVSKQFQCWEHVEGNMLNVVEGLEIYENVLSKAEASQLAYIVTQIHSAGKRGELGGQSFVTEKKSSGQMKEIVQFGFPLFGNPGDQVEPMPLVFSSLVDRLIEWHILPANRRPDCCCIDILEEGDCSPSPMFRQRMHTCSLCLLADCTMALGYKLTMKNGDCEGAFNVVLPQGSGVVLQGHSADIASQAIVTSPGRRILVTFSKMSGTKVLGASIMSDKNVYPVPNMPYITTSARSYGGLRGRVPTVLKHFSIPTASGVLPMPAPVQPLPLFLPQPVGNIQPLMSNPAGPPARPLPLGGGIINPGWAPVPRTSRPLNTGTGVFLPGGSSSAGSSPRPVGHGVVLSLPLDCANPPLSSNRTPRPSTSEAEESDSHPEKLNMAGPKASNTRPALRSKELPSQTNVVRNTKDEH